MNYAADRSRNTDPHAYMYNWTKVKLPLALCGRWNRVLPKQTVNIADELGLANTTH